MRNKAIDSKKKPYQPYLFALKEGKKIQQNFLDYSLMLIQVYHTETIRRPSSYN